MRPFHAVEDLVVEVRPRPAGTRIKQHFPRAAQHAHHALHVAPGADRHIFNGLSDIQKVQSAELPLRVRERVAVRLHAEAAAHDVGVFAHQRVDFGCAEDIEGALALFNIGVRGVDGVRCDAARYWSCVRNG